MLYLILYAVLAVILFMLIRLTYHFRTLAQQKPEDEALQEKSSAAVKEEQLSISQGYVYALIVAAIIALLLVTYFVIKGTPWEGHFMEWLNIVIRLMHVTFGIAWIGASFYFVFLENALNRTENVRDELAGNLWAVHGGGFYYLEKYKVAPKTIPKHLHWFKYEAYFTWLSGFFLLLVVYYFNAQAFLIDKDVLNITPAAGVSIGIGSFVVAWLIYHYLCKTPLINKGLWFALVGFIIAVSFAWFYTHVFSGRAAFIHFGAMLGTLMVGNVFFIIIPSQKAMVKAAKENKPLDPSLGKFASLRSLHNNYFTLPVLFVMVSNHFPSTFSYKYSWLILAIISLGTAGVKHWLNLQEKGQLNIWVLPVSVLILFAAAYMSAPIKADTKCKTEVSFTDVNVIMQKRCVQCHSSRPTDNLFTAPPNGVMFETPQNVAGLKDKILQRVVVTKTMPPNNKTNMTEEERQTIGCWIQQGAQEK